MRLSYILLFAIVTLLGAQSPYDSLISCLLPFPQEGLSRELQKPLKYKQFELNRQVAEQYDYYCASFLKKCEEGLYVSAPAFESPDRLIETTAEVHGEAMILAVLLAGEDSFSRRIFDQLYHFYMVNSHENGRMRARIFVGGNFDHRYATAADIDIAYSLLLAHCQWGSEGEINYLFSAKKLLASVEKSGANHELLRLLPGAEYGDNSLSSSALFRPSYFHTFAAVGSSPFWGELETATYQIMEQFSGKSVTGFIPDFIYGEKARAGSGDMGDLTSDCYSYAGRRLTLHLALALVHSKSKEAERINGRMAHWLLMSCGGDYQALRSGYTLSGQELTNYIDMPFLSSSAAAVSCIDSGGQLLDDLWDQMISKKEPDAATEGEKILTMLLLSGNWWSPCGEAVMLSESVKTSLFSPHISLMENNLQVEGLLGSKVALSFHSLRGQLLYKKRVNIYGNTLTEDLTYTNLTDGFHLLTLEGEGFTVTEKVIVSR